MMRTTVVAAAALAWAAATPAGAAADLEEGGALYAVQDRQYLDGHEFFLGVGLAPLDAYSKAVAASGSYTLHFSETWAWEVIGGSYAASLRTGLRDELERSWGVTPTAFPVLTWTAHSSLEWKPLYGKLAWLDGALVHGEVFALVGPALASYENGGEYVGPDLGAGARLYLSRAVSCRFEIRDRHLFHVEDLSVTRNELLLQAGIGIHVR